MMIDNVSVVIDSGTFSVEEMKHYISKVRLATKKLTLKKVTLSKKDNHIDIRSSFEDVPFDRLRRISVGMTDNGQRLVSK